MSFRRVTLIVALVLGLLAAPLAAAAQQPAKIHRIGYLQLRSGPYYLDEAFVQQLRDLGYIEGRNIAIEYRWAEKLERLPDLAAELVRLKVDVIVTAATPAIQAAGRATGTIPIVMAASFDAVGTGLVASLARPGGNITGLTVMSGEIAGKRLELLKEVIPRLSRVAVLTHHGISASALLAREAAVAGRRLGIPVQVVEARGPDDFDTAFSATTRERAGALIVMPSPVFHEHRGRIANLAAKRRLPAIADWRAFAEDGGLMAYGPSYPDSFRRAATYVDKILKGAKPADLPVEQPTRFELVINLKTAKALGLTIPPSVLIRADQVIE